MTAILSQPHCVNSFPSIDGILKNVNCEIVTNLTGNQITWLQHAQLNFTCEQNCFAMNQLILCNDWTDFHYEIQYLVKQKPESYGSAELPLQTQHW